MTHEQALQVVSVLTTAYPNANVSKETVKLYTQFLLDLSFEAGKAAALNIIGKSKWFPAISELRQAALELSPNYQLPAPDEAWGEVLQAFRKYAQFEKPSFSCEAIEKTVHAMGWMNLCMSENTVADRAHFVRIYETYANRHKAQYEMLPESKEIKEKLADQHSRKLPEGPGIMNAERTEKSAKVLDFLKSFESRHSL